MSTVSASFIEAFAVKCARYGVSVVDAPVSGGQVGAENGTLSIFAAAEAEILSAVESIFEAIGKKSISWGQKSEWAAHTRLFISFWPVCILLLLLRLWPWRKIRAGSGCVLRYCLVFCGPVVDVWRPGQADDPKRLCVQKRCQYFCQGFGPGSGIGPEVSIPSVLTNAALEKYLEAQQAGYGKPR